MTRNYQNLIILKLLKLQYYNDQKLLEFNYFKTFKASVSVNKMTKKLLEFNYFKTFKASVL